MRRYFGFLLILELLVIGIVTTIFKFIPDRMTAGAIAGTIFVLLGVYIVRGGWKEREKRTASYYAGCLHLFLSSLPLMITRLLNQSAGFEQVNVLGLPGPIFHRVSTTIYMILLIATIWDFVRASKAQNLKDATWPRDVG
ncbi:MAG: hypothetical protein EOP05_05215 [Proteobacteria bacterium]|nr:MAG: hypothetical protein EOP05_05215 [Pseudomonadota bacterium]